MEDAIPKEQIRRAMREYKVAAMYCKEQGNEAGFKAYRTNWCTLEVFCPVDPKEYW